MEQSDLVICLIEVFMYR